MGVSDLLVLHAGLDLEQVGLVIIKDKFELLVAGLINLSFLGCPLEVLNLIFQCFDLVLVVNRRVDWSCTWMICQYGFVTRNWNVARTG